MIGDFNVDMLQRNNKTKELNDYMSNYNLHFLLNKKTSLIDDVWSNITNNYNIFILDAY